MDVLNFSMDLLDPSNLVNEVVIGLILAIMGLFVGIIVAIVGGIVVFNYKWKKAEESKKREKLEQEQIKEKERKNEISNIIQSLLPEININQKRLQPLSDFVDKVLDCNNCEYSKKEGLPKKLNFKRTVYSYLLDKIGLFDYKIRVKVIQYYSEIEYIEEEYKKFDILHNYSHWSLKYLMVGCEAREKTKKIEIESFFRQTKKVYDLGEDLIMRMSDNKGA